MQVALPQEVVAAAQAAAAALHGQSQQFSVRFMATDQGEPNEQSEVSVSIDAAKEAAPASGWMPAEPSADLSVITGTGLLDSSHVTALPDGARLAAGSTPPGQGLPASTATSSQADSGPGDAEAAPGDAGKAQPQLQQERIAGHSQNTGFHDSVAREQTTSLAPDDADAGGNERASAHSHVEL